jgi:hypothetical protein
MTLNVRILSAILLAITSICGGASSAAGRERIEAFRPDGVGELHGYANGWDNWDAAVTPCLPRPGPMGVLDRCTGPDPGREANDIVRSLAIRGRWPAACGALPACQAMKSALSCFVHPPLGRAKDVCSGIFLEKAGASNKRVLRLSSSIHCSPTGEGCASPWLLVDSRRPAHVLLIGTGGVLFHDPHNGAIAAIGESWSGPLFGAAATVRLWQRTRSGSYRLVCRGKRRAARSTNGLWHAARVVLTGLHGCR